MGDYWVIREGKVKGEGRYWGARVQMSFSAVSVFGWRPDLAGAARFDRQEAVALAALAGGNNRIVRVTRKAKTMSLIDAAIDKDLARQQGRIEGIKQGRLAALEEAEKVCRDFAREWVNYDAMVARECADAIAALRSKS